jgi:antitoxin (DNA-binding transcriptional repressor) of toxin-antitoxin stability system
MPDALTVLTSLTASGALAAALLWLTRNWLSERLKQSIQHEYSQKLEAHKAQLKAANDVALEQLKTASSALLESKKLGHERILTAIDQLWAAIITIDENTPSIVGILDIILDEEYPTIFENEKMIPAVNELNDNVVQAGIAATKTLETQRPYFGEYLWYLFFGYRAIKGRLAYLIMHDRDKGSRVHWRTDGGIKQHLNAILSEQEVNEIYSTKIAPCAKMFEFIKQKILHTATQIISGERSAADSLDTAQEIAATIQESPAP